MARCAHRFRAGACCRIILRTGIPIAAAAANRADGNMILHTAGQAVAGPGDNLFTMSAKDLCMIAHLPELD